MIRQTAGRLLIGAVGSLLVISSAACTSSPLEELDAGDLDSIAANPACSNPEHFFGDPNYFGPAAGLYCLPDTGTGVVLHVYEDQKATEKVIADWADLISSDNQIVYGGNWFATGPKDTLERLFAGYERSGGPQSVAPPATAMSAEESNIALCSSIAYGVISELLADPTSSDLEQYFSSYVGMDALVHDIANNALDAGIAEYGSDDLLVTAHLTRYDDEIKQFCEQESR